MKKILALLLSLTLLLLPYSPALAWSSAGHQVIAAEAYRQLSPELKTKVNEILIAHPDYEKWEKAFIPGSPDLDLATYVFMRAATWPDEIRRAKGKGSRQYDHPQWHYVDYPLKAPKFPVEPGPSPTDDILYGIGQCESTLSSTTTSAEEKAAYLAWLIHLVGDIHQPLHCCSLVNETYPQGDKGGNEFYVKPASRGIKLHSLWDGLLGTSGKPQTHLHYAIEIEAQHPTFAGNGRTRGALGNLGGGDL